ncbi:MAG: WxcM-like domain-containing protein [Mediterranea sp.]|jgi:dTDP-4-dehydrorhamnose 3,5-epimerase|nr:WxcM-like domain-containing protein [Mediterranea sp.]
MNNIRVIEGAISVDHRGFISHMNDFDMKDVARFYFIHHPDVSVIRAWHAHQHEKKWFFAVKGSFTMAFVKIDDWHQPSPHLQPEVFHLSEKESRLLCIPEGYANGLKAHEPDSVLLVLSSKTMPAALEDSWRYDKSLWLDWESI